MNFLAHAFLSFGEPDLLLGNMISDFVKGRKKFDYPESIQKGIALHRAIDDFTDCHPMVAQAKNIFRKDYRLYSGPFVDVVFDHFLAKEIEDLPEFTQGIYQKLELNRQHHPDNFKPVFYSMQKYDWLKNYSENWGIERSFSGLVHRAKYMNDARTAFQLFEGNYSALQDIYSGFFPQLYSFSRKWMDEYL
jgi:acyl carrier protein phosphodiesterase